MTRTVLAVLSLFALTGCGINPFVFDDVAKRPPMHHHNIGIIKP